MLKYLYSNKWKSAINYKLKLNKLQTKIKLMNYDYLYIIVYINLIFMLPYFLVSQHLQYFILSL